LSARKKKKIRAVKIIQNEISTYSLCGPLDQADNCDFFLFQEDMAFFFCGGNPQTVYGTIAEYFQF